MKPSDSPERQTAQASDPGPEPTGHQDILKFVQQRKSRNFFELFQGDLDSAFSIIESYHRYVRDFKASPGNCGSLFYAGLVIQRVRVEIWEESHEELQRDFFTGTLISFIPKNSGESDQEEKLRKAECLRQALTIAAITNQESLYWLLNMLPSERLAEIQSKYPNPSTT